MERIRKLRKWGNSHAILITKIDMLDLKLKENGLVDISELKSVEKDENSL